MPSTSRSRQRPNQQERHAQILALLRREGIVRIAALAEAFDVTTETARRDLDELAKSGAIKRTYGGGASRSLTEEPGIGARGRTHAAERALIASAAAKLVEPHDVLMIDCGSTTALFANALAARNLALTVVTNALPVARALATSPSCRVILCPGQYALRESGVFGPDTLHYLGKFKANKAVIGAGGIAADAVSDADSASCAVKRAMMERSDWTQLLVDSSKFDLVQFEEVCTLDRLDELVSDAPPPRKLAARIKAAGVQLVVAS